MVIDFPEIYFTIFLKMKWIAHRGAARGNPYLENTLLAFQRCVGNADGIELDIHLTTDREVIVCHDPELEISETGQKVPISTLTWAKIHQMYPRIPRLKEIVDWLHTNSLLLYLEIKPGYSGIVPIILRLINSIKDRVTLISFSRIYLEEISKWDPTLSLGYLVANYEFLPADLPRNWKIGISHKLLCEIDKSTYPSINVWTVNSASLVKKCQEMGVDSITSDFFASELGP